jgi:Mg2+-importing ATPase
MNGKIAYPKLRNGNGWSRAPDREKGLSERAAQLASRGRHDTLVNLDCSLDGLVESDAVERIAMHGPNEVAHEKPSRWLVQLITCFKNPFIIVLVTLAVIQYVSAPDDPGPIIIISATVAISVGLQFWQEYRSVLAAEKLKALVRTTATVLRRASEDAQPEPREISIRETRNRVLSAAISLRHKQLGSHQGARGPLDLRCWRRQLQSFCSDKSTVGAKPVSTRSMENDGIH